MAFQHSHDDQALRLQAGAGEDSFIYLPSGSDRDACERQEKESDEARLLYILLGMNLTYFSL